MGESLTHLTNLYIRQTSSLAQYLSEMSPWVENEAGPPAVLLERIIRQERDWIRELTHLIESYHGVPKGSHFPIQFTDHHFLSLDFLLPHLQANIEKNLAYLRSLPIDQLDECFTDLVQSMISGKEKQLTELGEFTEPGTKTASSQ